MKALCIFLIFFFVSTVAYAAPDPSADALFGVLPKQVDSKSNPITSEKVSLGEKLYFDKRFSIAQDISCNSCHNLATYGVDREPTSPGHEGERGERNSPSVYNAALHLTQFWDGRAADVEEQALGPVMNPVEMAMPSEGEVLKRIKQDKEYMQMFSAAFPEEKSPVTFENFGKAIGAFERTLMTPGRFDEYLAGDNDALSGEEKKGMEVFIQTGCATCHNGPAFGGNMFQKLGLVKPYETEDLGRYQVTKKEVDKYMFKVPSLRNIAETYPYFHDGSVATLREAVALMAEYQLGRKIDEDDMEVLLAFLNALTGPIPEKYRE